MLTRLSLAIVCVFALELAGLGAEPPLAPQEGVVVLRNDHVLIGRITSVGDYCIVTLGEQGEARIPTSQVVMYCSTLDEAYLRKRDALQGEGARAHLDLANWCLRHDLPARAADQLLTAFAIDPGNPRLAQLERRLCMSQQQELSPEAPGAHTKHSLSPAEIEQMASELPQAAVEHFTQYVQPVLLNRCATNACHGIRSQQEFRVLRPLKGQPAPHRLTQRNLVASLSIVNRERPEASPLLTATRGPHGGLETPLFEEQDTAPYEQLVAWVKQLADSHFDPGTPSDSPSMPEGPPDAQVTGSPGKNPWDAAKEDVSSNQTDLQSSDPGAVNTAGEWSVSGFDDTKSGQFTHDPFDPEIFNRQHLHRVATP